MQLSSGLPRQAGGFLNWLRQKWSAQPEPVRRRSEPVNFDMSKMVLVTGFARGGTSWLRDCLAAHPAIQAIPHEMPIFREYLNDPEGLKGRYADAVAEHRLAGPYFVNKAPANAPFVGHVARQFPEAKFIFIIRDPRDVLVSHQRGNQSWLRGANSTVTGCMNKLARYYAGYRDAGADNILLVRYEGLHQDFMNTMQRLFEFIGLPTDAALLREIYQKHNFQAATGRTSEDRDAAARKGVIGDWANFLTAREIRWYRRSEFWSHFLQEHRYGWEPVCFERVLRAMAEAGVQTLAPHELLTPASSADRRLLLLHDIDLLRQPIHQETVRQAARIESQFGFASLFNFLPVDDPRYRPLTPEQIVALIHEIRALNPQAEAGLHLNAAERFFPASLPELPDSHPDVRKAIDYLHEQVNAYAHWGVCFRLATAHGYGRAKKRPNNRDTAVFASELERRGIALFDAGLRQQLYERAAHYVRISDVGGSYAIRGLPAGMAVDDAETYRRLPAGTVIEFLTHPGNYDPRRPTPLGLRTPDLPPEELP